jgi:hypothetical protein
MNGKQGWFGKISTIPAVNIEINQAHSFTMTSVSWLNSAPFPD